MTDIAIFFLSLSGFSALLLAMARHQQDWLKRKLPPRQSRLLRITGFALLAFAFLVAGRGLGWAYGPVVWLGWLSAAAALIVTFNLNRERITGKGRS